MLAEGLVDYVNVMLCITVDGIPKAGIVHNPFKKQTGFLSCFFGFFYFWKI